MSNTVKNSVLALVALSVIAGTVMVPSMADAYTSRACKYEEKHNSRTGTVVGAVAGGAIGGSVANTHNKGLGTVLGAVAGGLVGSKMGKDHGKYECTRYQNTRPVYHHRSHHHY